MSMRSSPWWYGGRRRWTFRIKDKDSGKLIEHVAPPEIGQHDVEAALAWHAAEIARHYPDYPARAPARKRGGRVQRVVFLPEPVAKHLDELAEERRMADGATRADLGKVVAELVAERVAKTREPTPKKVSKQADREPKAARPKRVPGNGSR